MDILLKEMSKKEEKISSLKRSRKEVEIHLKETERVFKNKAASLGVALDFIADALIPGRVLAVIKGFADVKNAPSYREVESLLMEVNKTKSVLENLDNELYKMGIDLRQNKLALDNVVRDWRYSKCK